MNTHNDILLDDTYDLLAQDGDLLAGDCLLQQQAVLLASGEGEWKQSPVAGIGLDAYLLDENELGAFRKIRSQFTSDGLRLTTLKKQTDGNLIIQSQHA